MPTYKENMTPEEKQARDADIEKYVNMERMPEGLSPLEREKRIDYEIQLRKNIELLNAAFKENNEKQKPHLENLKAKEEEVISKYTTDVLSADETLTGEERENKLRSLSKAKDEALEEIAEDRKNSIAGELNITEDQIQEYLSPERMALMEKVADIKKSEDDRREIAGKIKDVPITFTRCLFAMVKDPAKEADANVHNNHLDRIIAAPDYRSQIDRRQLIVDDVNKIVGLDAQKMSLNRPFNDLVDYVFNNMDACEVGFEFERTHKNMESALGFGEREEYKSFMKDVQDKGVVIGGRGRMIKELLEDDSYMRFPFEQMSTAQMNVMMSAVMRQPEEYGITDMMQVSKLGKYLEYSQDKEIQKPRYNEPEKGKVISTSSFEEKLPDMEVLKQKVEAIEKRLNDTDHWYNRRSSSNEYKAMREAITSLKTEMSALVTADGDVKKFNDASLKFSSAAKDYMKHVGKTPRNDNQKRRYEAALELQTLIGSEFPSGVVVGMVHNKAVAKPEEKEFYDQFAVPQEKEKPIWKDLSKEDNQNIKREDEITQQTKEYAKNAKGSVKQMYEMLSSARQSLSNELKKTEPNQDVIKTMVATVITCQMYRSELEGSDGVKANPNMTVVSDNVEVRFTDMKPVSAKALIGSETIKLMNSDAFKNAMPKLNEEKLHQFLRNEDSAKTEIMRDICGNMSLQKNKTESNQKSSVFDKTQQIDAPKKEKGLGK